MYVWYIYLHLLDFDGFHVGKSTSPMDPTGWYISFQAAMSQTHDLCGVWQSKLDENARNPDCLHGVIAAQSKSKEHAFYVYCISF